MDLGKYKQIIFEISIKIFNFVIRILLTDYMYKSWSKQSISNLSLMFFKWLRTIMSTKVCASIGVSRIYTWYKN